MAMSLPGYVRSTSLSIKYNSTYCERHILGMIRTMIVTRVALEDTAGGIIHLRIFQLPRTYSVPKETDVPMPWVV